MHIFIVTQEDPFYIPRFFKRFLQRQEEGITIVGVMIQQPLGNRTARGLAQRIWSLYGTVGFGVMGFRYLWRRVLRLLGPFAPTVTAYCTGAGVPVVPGQSVNTAEFVAYVLREKIDLIVSVSASQIFKEPLLSTPPMGCINLHNAPLPAYRGMLPNFWQLYHHETKSVLTIHRMVAELDGGAILLQRETPIPEKMSLEQLIRTTKESSADALWDLLVQMRDGTSTERPMPETGGSYFTWPTRQQARELQRRRRLL